MIVPVFVTDVETFPKPAECRTAIASVDVGTGTGEEGAIKNVTVWMDILVIRMMDYVSTVNIFTASKRSLGQGNVFTPVCHSIHGGTLHPGESASKGVCIKGVCIQGQSASRRSASRGCWADSPAEIQSTRGRAVHILLKYILVIILRANF